MYKKFINFFQIMFAALLISTSAYADSISHTSFFSDKRIIFISLVLLFIFIEFIMFRSNPGKKLKYFILVLFSLCAASLIYALFAWFY